MKRLFMSMVCLASLIWACQKEEEKVSPTVQKVSALTPEEQAVADKMGTTISLGEFNSMTEAYKASVSAEETRAVAYGKTVLEQLLAQKGCVGLRFYLAKDKLGKTTLVFKGVDKDGNDIIPSNARTTDGGGAGGGGPLCPNKCAPPVED